MDSNKKKLKYRINILRKVLNEICCTLDETGLNTKILSVSQQMDELIVEYMKLDEIKMEKICKGSRQHK